MSDPLINIQTLLKQTPSEELFRKLKSWIGQCTPEQTARAGRIVKKQLAAENWQTFNQSWPLKKVAVMSNFTADAIVDQLQVLLFAEGIRLQSYIAPYNQYMAEIINPESELYAFEADISLCLLDEQVITQRLPQPWHADDWLNATKQVNKQLPALFQDYQQRVRKPLVINTLPLPRLVYQQIIDYKSRSRISESWRQLNANLCALANSQDGLLILDTDVHLQAPFVSQLRDPRLAQYAQMRMSDELLLAFAHEITAVIRNLCGKTKKALVLDLDNTLWGGILGDDGIEGIELGNGGDGDAYKAFQQLIKQLNSQGILITVCSKNDEAPVQHAFNNHPDMQIKETDISWLCANWQPKPENIRTIAKGLNIGTDSLVFVDDSVFERNSVMHFVPETEVIDLPADVYQYTKALLAQGWFTCLTLGQEDFQRAQKYANEQKRQEFFLGFESMESYLRELNLQVDIFIPDNIAQQRVAQLTQRTNQFNMTTIRMTTGDLQQWSARPDHHVLAIRCRDQFGDNGLVGSVLVRPCDQQKNTAVIENFILSCRVFSRGIEQAVLSDLLTWLLSRGITQVTGLYLSTEKNAKVKDFYLNNGFQAADDNVSAGVFHHDLKTIAPPADWISVQSYLSQQCPQAQIQQEEALHAQPDNS